MKLKRVILADLIFLLIIGFLAVLSIFSYRRINDLNDKANWLTHTSLVKLKLEQILSYVKDAETGQRGFLLTNDSTHLTPYLEAYEKQQQVLKELDSLVKDNPAQRINANNLRFSITQRLNRLSTVIRMVNVGAPETRQVLLEGKALMNEVRNLISEMIRIEDDLWVKRVQQKDYAAAITPFYSLVLSVFAIFAVAFTYFIFRSETRLRFHAEDSIKKLNEYFKDLPAAFSIVKGRSHIHEMSNTLYNEITGNRQLAGKSIREAFPELKGQGFYEILDQVYTSGKPYVGREMPLQFNAELHNQKNTFYNFIYQPIFNKNNQPEGILIFGYDISEMIEARTKLEEEEQRTRLAIEAANIGTFDWDMENKAFISSPRLMEIFGFKGKENATTHQDLINTFHPEDKPKRNQAVEESYTKGSLMYEARVIQPGGAVRWVSVYGKVIHSGARVPTRMYGTVIDITDKKVSWKN